MLARLWFTTSPTEMIRKLGIVQLFLVALTISTLPPSALAAAAHQALVLSFIDKSEAVMSATSDPRPSGLMATYRRHFDMTHLTSRVVPPALWTVATRGQKRRARDKLLCRLAMETIRRAPSDRPSGWDIAGERRSDSIYSVGIRFSYQDGRAETVIFDVRPNESRLLIVDIRSGRGRLSARLAEEIARDAETDIERRDVEGWLNREPCRR